MQYSDEVIRQAKELWEIGTTYTDVAEKLGIGRWMTIFDWKTKFNWTRKKEGFSDLEQLEVWEDIAEKALEFLQKGEFKTQSEALKIYDLAIHKIQGIKKKKTLTEDNSSNKIMGKLQVV